MTPLHIEIALHYHCMATPLFEHQPARRYAQATVAYTRDLERAGLIVKDDTSGSGYRGTEGLKLFVEALEAIPLPRRAVLWTFDQDAELAEPPVAESDARKDTKLSFRVSGKTIIMNRDERVGYCTRDICTCLAEGQTPAHMNLYCTGYTACPSWEALPASALDEAPKPSVLGEVVAEVEANEAEQAKRSAVTEIMRVGSASGYLITKFGVDVGRCNSAVCTCTEFRANDSTGDAIRRVGRCDYFTANENWHRPAPHERGELEIER